MGSGSGLVTLNPLDDMGLQICNSWLCYFGSKHGFFELGKYRRPVTQVMQSSNTKNMDDCYCNFCEL